MPHSGRFQFVRIVLFSVLAAIIYGVLHDLVTAHLCLEYFTIAHPPLPIPQTSLVMALAWGVIATWWVGAILGTALGLAARIGSAPKIGLAQLKRPIIMVMAVSGVGAILAMGLGALLFQLDVISVGHVWEYRIPEDRHHVFMAAAWAHSASYLIAGIGGAFLVVRTALKRYQEPLASTEDGV